MGADAERGVWTSLLDVAPVREIQERARTVRWAHPVATAASTQDVALDLAAAGAPSGTLVVTDLQTAGRGRRGRTWDDHPDGRTLATTLLLDVADAPALGLVPHALGLALVAACAVTAPDAPPLRLKWPNDVVHRPAGEAARKLCGILVEREEVRTDTGARDVLLCGIGVDVDLRDVVSPADRTCLATVAGRPPDRTRLLAALIAGLDAAVTLLRDPERLLDRYRRVSDTIGRDVRVEPTEGEPVVGVARTVDEHGRLVVTTQAGEHAILSGTVRDADAASPERTALDGTETEERG